MGGGGFWIFVIIVVANLVITIIKKSAEKKQAAARAAGLASAPQQSAPKARTAIARSGAGDLEIILERPGDEIFEVVKVLREDLGMPLPEVRAVLSATPAVVATKLTRGEAGALRSRFEQAGAGVSIRRAAGGTTVELQRATMGSPPISAEAAPDRAAASPSAAETFEQRRLEALRRRVSREPQRAEPPARQPEPPKPPRTPARTAKSQPQFQSRPPSRTPLRSEAETASAPMPRGERPPVKPASSGTRVGRLRALAHDRVRVRDAFLLQELLRRPLSERGPGGRESERPE